MPYSYLRNGLFGLLNAGTNPNSISIHLLSQAGIGPSATRRTITVANGDIGKWKGLMREYPMAFAELATNLDFLAGWRRFVRFSDRKKKI